MTLHAPIRIGVLALIAALLPAVDNANAASHAEAPVIAEHEPLAVAITIRNPNDRAVRVDRLDSTCSCTTLELRDRFLLPHATTTLDVVIDNHNRSGEIRVGLSIYLTDPDLEPIEATALWTVTPNVAVDVIPAGADSKQRPADIAYRDVYRFVAKERPDELARLNKRIRLFSPPDQQPEGGLRVTGIDYAGTLWRFEHAVQSDGSTLITATARDPATIIADGLREETATVRTNHPRKAAIDLRFIALIAKDAGSMVFDPDGAPGMQFPPPPGE
ncbi:MAG TPA: DUF1573 domain-containing protein [Planctomycetota bacterium]|nr:DUF1573 domain-containing protein [Planctomycetota bacterium]